MTDMPPTDPADDLTSNTSDDPAPEDAEPDAAPTVPDEAAAGEGSTPGEGTGGAHPMEADVDAVQTTDHGRETYAARSDTSDAVPTPTETPVDTRTGPDGPAPRPHPHCRGARATGGVPERRGRPTRPRTGHHGRLRLPRATRSR